MSKPVLHGLRNSQKIVIDSVRFVVDTKSDSDWVVINHISKIIMDLTNLAVRLSKHSAGRVFQQSFSNPDYDGRESYMIQFTDNNGNFQTYDSQGKAGDYKSALRSWLKYRTTTFTK